MILGSKYRIRMPLASAPRLIVFVCMAALLLAACQTKTTRPPPPPTEDPEQSLLAGDFRRAAELFADRARQDRAGAKRLWLRAAERSARQAYAQAGVGPEDIDVFELHDAFTIMSALSLEACGFAERGQGPRLALEGEIQIGGRIPICTRGGLKARGHPVGATGVYQIVEVVQQLRGEAGATQVEGAKIGMTQNIGGSGSNIITHIFRAD
jgi:acetyl-CoA acetyltransferase